MSELPFFDDSDISRVLCVVAHPDDMEYGASAAVARWAERGVEVSYLLLTAGEVGIRDRDPREVGPLRTEEQREACREVGVSDLEVLDLPDGLLEHNLDTRRHIARAIRRLRPDVVLTQSWELRVPWGLNHVDHRVTGLATVDAVRDADNPWIFTELADEGLEPWGVTWLLVPSAEPDHLIDVTGEPVRCAVRSLAAHKVYLDALEDHMPPEELVESITTEFADRSGDPAVTHVLAVEAHQVG